MKKYRYLILLSLPFFLASCSAVTAKTYDVNDYRVMLDYKEGFKIMQLTDLHFAVQTDYQAVTSYLSKNIKNSAPDLIVLTGDVFMDADSSIVRNVLNFINTFNIPFAFNYGNHDHQGSYGFYFINDYLKTLNNSLLIDFSDDDIFGCANYFIDLMAGTKIMYRLYIVDSGSYHYNGIDFDYDVIHDDQLTHMEKINKEDGTAPSLAFYHIPLYEERDAFAAVTSGENTNFKGTNNEKVCVGYKRTDAFSRMKNIGVVGHFFGHDHINYSDILYNGVTLTYGLKSTPEIYNDDDLIGYKEITLNSAQTWGLSNIETKVVSYGK
jgi:Predicted phosphohydrolases